ncbi:MAG TPA: hypothetical protein VF451_02835 [Acidobacteriota bacterium]
MNEKTKTQGRIQEIDIAKGMACFSMIAAHLLGGKLLPASTFAAPLFFACSGMNVLLLLEKTKKNKCYDLFHILFPLLLFFGGITQIAIVHRRTLRLIPEFLQFIALAILLLFALSKLFKNPRHCGYFFPVPFLVQQLLPMPFLRSFAGSPLGFLFGGGFALFPWLGFILFGVFILSLSRKSYIWLQATLCAGFILSHAIAGIPLQKFWMSLSYILLALLVITLAFSLGRVIAVRVESLFFRHLAEFFALPGRNSLMFVYLNYFVLRFFILGNLVSSVYPMLLLQTSYLFLLCFIILKFYEKVKTEGELFLPSLTMGVILATLRWGGMLSPRIDLRLIDMAIGILFAFLYVQLRRRFAAFCERKIESRA